MRLPDPLSELVIARGDGSYHKVIKQYKQVNRLTLNDWFFFPLQESVARDLFEIAKRSTKRRPLSSVLKKEKLSLCDEICNKWRSLYIV